jgi:hypothetical protein
MSTKEQYWKYSLIVIILFMGVIIFRQITPFRLPIPIHHPSGYYASSQHS